MVCLNNNEKTIGMYETVQVYRGRFGPHWSTGNNNMFTLTRKKLDWSIFILSPCVVYDLELSFM